MASNTRQLTCFSFFMPKNPPKYSINHLNFYCMKQIDYNFRVCACMYCNRSQKTSQRVKNNSYATRLRLVSYFLFFTRYHVICDLLEYLHTEKCNLFVNERTIMDSKTVKYGNKMSSCMIKQESLRNSSESRGRPLISTVPPASLLL